MASKGDMITVDQLAEDQPIYAINHSNGDYLLNLKAEDGRNELVPIPKTWIPIQLTNFAEPKLFKRSSDFRRTVASGNLEIVSIEKAQEILSRDDAKAELERVRKDAFSDINYSAEPEGITPVQAAADMGTENVNNKVQDIMLREDLSDDDRKAMLINEHNTEGLSKDDLDFIMVTTDNTTKVYNWASQIKNENSNNLFKDQK